MRYKLPCYLFTAKSRTGEAREKNNTGRESDFIGWQVEKTSEA
jgi:hypothetical protein